MFDHILNVHSEHLIQRDCNISLRCCSCLVCSDGPVIERTKEEIRVWSHLKNSFTYGIYSITRLAANWWCTTTCNQKEPRRIGEQCKDKFFICWIVLNNDFEKVYQGRVNFHSATTETC